MERALRRGSLSLWERGRVRGHCEDKQPMLNIYYGNICEAVDWLAINFGAS
jgi:hypothetical protein